MTDAKLKSDVEDLLYREALFLDEQRWDDWLALYVDEIEFWAPAWKSEHQPTGDPKSEISLIYMTSKKRLEVESGADSFRQIGGGPGLAQNRPFDLKHFAG